MEKSKEILMEMIEELKLSKDSKDKERVEALNQLISAQFNEVATPIGTLKTYYCHDGIYREIYIDLITSEGYSFPISCTAFEDDTNKVVTKAWTGNEDDYSVVVDHNLSLRIPDFAKDIISESLDDENGVTHDILDETIQRMADEAAKKFLDNKGANITLTETCNEVIKQIHLD